MSSVLRRIFGTAVPEQTHTQAFRRLPIERIRHRLRLTLHDCTDDRSRNVLVKIERAKTPGDLWMVRSDLYQCISYVHSQQVAAARINELLEVFDGWVPERQLTRI